MEKKKGLIKDFEDWLYGEIDRIKEQQGKDVSIANQVQYKVILSTLGAVKQELLALEAEYDGKGATKKVKQDKTTLQ